MKRNIFFKILFWFRLAVIFKLLLVNNIAAQQLTKEKLLKNTALKKERLGQVLIGGIINKSDLKIGFLNDGRFCAPKEFIPALPSALYGDYGYLDIFDLWVGIPDGPWAPKVWDADSQKYISMGPTVSGTIYEPLPTGTDWSTINATNGILYTADLIYSDVYPPSKNFDFLLSPTSEYEQSFPRNFLTGLREWPGRWKKNFITGKPIVGEFFGDENVFLSFDDKTLAADYYPNKDYYSQRHNFRFPSQQGYSIGAEILAQVVSFHEAYISNMVIFDLQIINTSKWDYHDVYLGIFYESRNPIYYLTDERPTRWIIKNKFLLNEYHDVHGEIIPYNLSYSHNEVGFGSNDKTYFGVQFLKTPFAEDDQIDNDGDGLIDESGGEELGLTGWHYFEDRVFYFYPEREKLQYKILSGDTSGLGSLIDETFFFKDAEGNLDPNFDYPERIKTPFQSTSQRGEIRWVLDVLSCGPINWPSGDTLNFVFGILAAENFDRLKASALMAQKIVINNYHYSEGPPPPTVTSVAQEKKITLYWDNIAESAKDILTRYQDFEGYKIYRTTVDPAYNDWGTPLFDAKGKQTGFLPIAECDLNNGIQGFDKVYPFLNLGDDTGLFHSWTDTSVTNGVTYWYSVCSYDHGIVENEQLNPAHLPASPMQECPKGIDPDLYPNLVKVIPGIYASNTNAPIINVEKLRDSAGNGPINAVILDPYAITGHEYLLSFEDSTYGYAAYSLFDETENKLTFEKEYRTSGEEGVIFDGIQLYVNRYDDLDVLNDSTYWFKYETGEPSECTWNILGGKLIWDPYPFEYEIRFTEKIDTSYYMKKTAPFEVWNTILNVKSYWDIYYNSKSDTTDSLKNTWSSGDMIYIWDYFDDVRKFTLRVTITEQSYFTHQGIVNVPPEPGDALHIYLKRPFIAGDQFRISTKAMTKEKQTITNKNKVKVVPNPYTVHAGWELSSTESKIQFINLPSECTIHIFSMAGDQVKTLYHNDINLDYEFWDLLNFSNLKVSYGLYTYVVEIPDGKNQKGKFVILR
jgi:hypothetical protein